MISELAQVHPEAKLAANVTVEAFAIIEKDVEIGEGTRVASHAIICNGARIGKDCTIHPGAVISGEPQDLKFVGEKTTVEIGDNTVIREYATISRGTKDKLKTVVGSNVLIMAYVHIAHDCVVGDHCILANSVQVAGHCTIEDWAIIGGTTAIHQFCSVGKHSMVAGGALLGKDVPPFSLTTRTPCGFSSVNTIGLRRRGYSNERIRGIQEIYKGLFQEGKNVTQGIEWIENNIEESEEKKEILNFISTSARGIVRPVKEELS